MTEVEQKEIEEMTEDVNTYIIANTNLVPVTYDSLSYEERYRGMGMKWDAQKIATELYNAGYRKTVKFKDTSKNKVLDILNKFEFILGQRAGRELWFDKTKKLQDEDLFNFNEDIKYIKKYINNNKQV